MPTTPVAQPLPPISYLQDPGTYKAILDGNASIAQRIANAWAPFANPTPNMAVSVAPGAFTSGVTLTEKGTMTVGNTTSASAAVTLTGPVDGIANGMVVIGIPTTTINIAATTANGSPTVTGISSGTTQAWVGANITGTGIPAATTVIAVGAGTLTLSANATASATNILLIQSQNPIPDGTTVSTIVGTTLTLSAPATATVTGLQIMVAQTSGTLSAPVSNSRIDRGVINCATGALEIVAGTPGASPTPPAIPAGRAPCFQVRIYSTDTYIGGSRITDERDLVAMAINSSGVRFLGGTVDNTAIGNSTPAAGSFTTLTTSGNGTIGNRATLGAEVRFVGVLSPTQLTANTNNWAPTNLSIAQSIRLSTDASRNLTGLTGGASGRLIRLMNIGSFPLVITHDDTGNSTAANCFLCPNAVNFTLGAGCSTDLQYDNTSSRWRVVGGTSVPNASTTVAGIVELATNAEVLAGTDPDRVPPVSAMSSHLGVAKAWVNFNGTGTPAIQKSYNVTSITDGGVGLFTVNLTSATADANGAPFTWASGLNACYTSGSTTALTSSAIPLNVYYITGGSVVLGDPTQATAGVFD